VVIPAFNAARTLPATLESVLAQTFADFEAILIDDGSTDATSAIAAAFARRDPRLRIVTRSNTGVADARNAGIQHARAPLVAPIDADDVWHATYLEKMHAALTSATGDTLFAFANFREIDPDSRVLGTAPAYRVDGRAFHRFLLKNFVGNGSGMLFRRAAALAVGGYERRLQHEFDAPGCEDWLLQLRLAGRGNVIAVGEYLVGYRRVPGCMSEDQVRMCRSRIHAFEILFGEIDCRHTTAARWGIARAKAESMLRELLAGNLVPAVRLLLQALARDPVGTLDAVAEGTLRAAAKAFFAVVPNRRWWPGRPFADYGSTTELKPLQNSLLARRLARLAAIDGAEQAAQEIAARVLHAGDAAAAQGSSRHAGFRRERA
jgi:hypothetical protein